MGSEKRRPEVEFPAATDLTAETDLTADTGGGRSAAPVLSADAMGVDLPDDPDDAVEVLLAALHDARAEAGTYLDDLRRVAADFDNFRKRAIRDQQTIVDRAAERVLSSMLPVLDSFDAALAIEATTEAEEKLLRGMRSTHAQLMDVLTKEGLEPIPTVGEPFDPEVHEAVMTSGGDGPLLVSRELRRGYRLRGRVLRAALVALEPSN
jgi:molecular chaperone GrpE